ncbi:iron(III) transport system ATP-binding protein [Natronospira proteinivora]|uniref:Iron(III) transport system ATP-binding protein n=1 Tax=Natronospira proteinivora TaxID=1807133 RepID=A0ABT1GB15_9GAMM|nr:ABC transporter ATP-binding protein [Natronospira proteinivora]MCP1728476.1 iron(III) transport system ATP-binding protein [Natronospira proteinivora]
MLLELEQLRLSYGDHEVLRGLTLHLTRGQIGCLLGPSGCGKTTVLRAIAGFEPVDSGEVRIDNRVFSQPGRTVPPEQRDIRIVFQDYALFPHLNARDNVAFGLREGRKADRRAQAEEMLSAVGLADAVRAQPHELSGGQQQRVALARALVARPRLILLDEPFSNLDVELRERLGIEVRSLLKAFGATALMVTHDQQEAFAVADEVGVMNEGTLQQWDRPYNLYHRPANRFVADFVGQGVLIPGRVAEPGKVDIELGRLEGRLITDVRPGTDVDVLLRPDDIIHDDDAPMTAEVRYKVFRGAEILYTLRLDSGDRVLALVPSHHDHRIGEQIGIRLDTEHIVAFPRGEARGEYCPTELFS